MDDVSQTRTSTMSGVGEVAAVELSMADLKARARRRREVDACDVDRAPLGEMPAADFYAEGCDGSSVFVIPAESDAADAEGTEAEEAEPVPMTFDFIAEVKGKGTEIDVDALMAKDDFVSAPKAVLLEPIEKAEEGFEVWEVRNSVSFLHLPDYSQSILK